MKAVNLIPADEAGRSRGRSGGAAYALIGALALLVAMSATYALAGRSVRAKQRELAAVTAQADATEARAASLKTYVRYADLRKARVQTVKSLVDSRFDWSHALGEVARTVPSGAWITSLRATVNPSVSVGGGTGNSLRAALPVPAIELTGCAAGQDGVARTIASLRGMSGVQRVSLATSQKGDATTTATGSAAGGEGCGSRAQFGLTVFFEAGRTPNPATTTAAPQGGSTP